MSLSLHSLSADSGCREQNSQVGQESHLHDGWPRLRGDHITAGLYAVQLWRPAAKATAGQCFQGASRARGNASLARRVTASLQAPGSLGCLVTVLSSVPAGALDNCSLG